MSFSRSLVHLRRLSAAAKLRLPSSSMLADASVIDCGLRPSQACFSLAEAPPEAQS